MEVKIIKNSQNLSIILKFGLSVRDVQTMREAVTRFASNPFLEMIKPHKFHGEQGKPPDKLFKDICSLSLLDMLWKNPSLKSYIRQE